MIAPAGEGAEGRRARPDAGCRLAAQGGVCYFQTSMNASPSARVLPVHTPELFAAAVAEAAALLRAGEVVALPTETVYGLAANALDPQAVRRVFKVKGRPPHNPLIVHVADLEMARRCVAQWPPAAQRLAEAFWPGPLTLVLPRAPEIPDVVTAGGSTVGIRWPNHPLMQAVIRRCGFPLAAPSANLSGRVSPTSAEHVRQDLGGRIPLIVDGGPSPVGIESTVLDLSVQPARILRPGMVHAESLCAVLGEVAAETGEGRPAAVLKSPGQLTRHYSPRATLRVWSWTDEADLTRQVASAGCDPARTHVIAHTHIPTQGRWREVSVIPHDPEAFARAFYAELRRCDAKGAQWIIVEAVPQTGPWQGIADRLRRAAAS